MGRPSVVHGDERGKGVMPPTDPFGEYVFVNGEWRYDIGLDLPDRSPVTADVEPEQCSALKPNGHRCAITARPSGLCAIHERQAAR